MSTALAVRPDKIRIAELTDGARTIFLMPRPEIATSEATEDRRASRIRAFAAERIEDFLDAITHS